MIDYQGAVPKTLQIKNLLILIIKRKLITIIVYLFTTNYNQHFILFLKEGKEEASLASWLRSF